LTGVVLAAIRTRLRRGEVPTISYKTKFNQGFGLSGMRFVDPGSLIFNRQCRVILEPGPVLV